MYLKLRNLTILPMKAFLDTKLTRPTEFCVLDNTTNNQPSFKIDSPGGPAQVTHEFKRN